MASGWAQLPDDLLDNVAQRTAGIKDYVRLRAVCKSWRSFLRPRSRPPWLMLPYDPCSESCVRGFLDASDGTVHEIDLPDTRGKRCCGSSHGWLVLERWPAVGLGRPVFQWEVRVAALWWEPLVVGGWWPLVVLVVAAEAVVFCRPGDVTLGAEEEAVFCRPTDASWTPLACPAGAFAAVDVACQSGLFHLVSHHGRVAVFDLVSPLREVPTRRDRLHALAHTWDGRCLVQRRGGCGHEPLLLATWSGGGGAG
nr:uncharacterized protein LOC9268846 [Oryza sativa Japonica Group]